VKKTSTSATAQNDTRNFASLFGGGELKTHLLQLEGKSSDISSVEEGLE
jgi:hypothetical protein